MPRIALTSLLINTLTKRNVRSYTLTHKNVKFLPSIRCLSSTAIDTTSFSNLSPIKFQDLANVSNESKRALADVLKYEYMTKVQHATFESVMSGIDVVAKAKTGTGKTIAFLLPIIERMQPTTGGIQVLILSPTRELAIQIAKEGEKLIKFHGLQIGYVIGGTNMKHDINLLTSSVDILVATPGRLVDHLTSNNGSIQKLLSKLSVLIMDEADHLLDMGFKPALNKILSHLPEDRQTLFYSATFPNAVKQMAKDALHSNHVFINTIEEGDQQTNQQVVQEYLCCPMEALFSTLEQLLQQHMRENKQYKVIVFSNTARTAGFMAQVFKKGGYNALEIHSRKSQSAREKVSKQFHASTKVIMFSSDVSARGVDYPNVSLIVQVGLTSREQYIHRVGRTGRAGKVGQGVLLLGDFEQQILEQLKDLEIKPASLEVESPAKFPVTLLLKDLPSDLTDSAEKAYQAFLGFYNSNQKNIHMSKTQVVQLANTFSAIIGLSEPPALLKKTIGKMNLKNIPGLRTR